MTIADDVFAKIEAHEAEHGGVDVCDICGKRNPDIDQDCERTTYTFDDGSQIADEGDLGCWVIAEPLIARAEAAWGGPVATARHLGIAESSWWGYKSGVRAMPEYVRKSVLAHLEVDRLREAG